MGANYLAKTDESQNARRSPQRRMGHGPDNGLAGQEILQTDCSLLHHLDGCRAGDINMGAQETARQALINVMADSGDVARVVNRGVALIAIDSLGEIVGGMYMKRSKQHHRHIDRQYHPGKQPLFASDAVMC